METKDIRTGQIKPSAARPFYAEATALSEGEATPPASSTFKTAPMLFAANEEKLFFLPRTDEVLNNLAQHICYYMFVLQSACHQFVLLAERLSRSCLVTQEPLVSGFALAIDGVV